MFLLSKTRPNSFCSNRGQSLLLSLALSWFESPSGSGVSGFKLLPSPVGDFSGSLLPWSYRLMISRTFSSNWKIIYGVPLLRVLRENPADCGFVLRIHTWFQYLLRINRLASSVAWRVSSLSIRSRSSSSITCRKINQASLHVQKDQGFDVCKRLRLLKEKMNKPVFDRELLPAFGFWLEELWCPVPPEK